jgi:hypothetical protein
MKCPLSLSGIKLMLFPKVRANPHFRENVCGHKVAVRTMLSSHAPLEKGQILKKFL